MSLMSTCLGRLGSRFSIVFDPIRKRVHYGSLGMFCQSVGKMNISLDDGRGHVSALPLTDAGGSFYNVDQFQTMTSVGWEANCLRCGTRLTARFVAPFWPRDEAVSTVPGYIVKFRLERLERIRWEKLPADRKRKGRLRFSIDLPRVQAQTRKGRVRMAYPVRVEQRTRTGEGGEDRELFRAGRHVPEEGSATDLIVPLDGPWKVCKGVLEADFDVSDEPLELTAAVVSYCPDALFERMGEPMALKYTELWDSPEAVADYVEGNWPDLLAKSAAFDELFTESALPVATRDLTALSFQSYLMCSLWAVGKDGADWYSVWEGSCWYNSTVDVTYNEAMFYFACWPELLEKIFAEWACHANDAEAEAERRAVVSDDDKFVSGPEEFEFPGAVMEHDMGAGWTANGQSYHHAMPVEENSDFLLLLYAHGKWWGREKLFKTYHEVARQLAEYLLWADSTGNGMPDRGTANTIDDATPAVQYGRDNVYLGIKRLAALHAAGRMFEHVGDPTGARKCKGEVRKAVETLNAGWLGDHWGVCLDKSAEGLVDSWTRKPLPYTVLPGWDAYSLYTTNGLLYLMMVDDLPNGLSKQKLRRDVVNATAASMTRYGCGHSSMDQENMWVSMNVWRDCAAGYLGENFLTHCERYWNQQLFANGPGAEKANCFTETSLTNNLVWYPRNTAAFGLPMAMAQLTLDRSEKKASVRSMIPGSLPLFPLADWKKGIVPKLEVEPTDRAKLVGDLSAKPRGIEVDVKS